MNNRDVINFLKNQDIENPSPMAVERCIASLPQVKKTARITPLIRLQLRSLSWGVYLLSALSIALGLYTGAVMEKIPALSVAGLISAFVGMLLWWHILLSTVGSMTEIEHTCRYDYAQILFSRIICLVALTLAASLLVTVPIWLRGGIGFIYGLSALLPTAIGAAAAVCWTSYVSNHVLTIMAIYLVAALLTCYLLEFLLLAGAVVIAVLLLGCFAILMIQGHILMNRRLNNEAYPI